MLSLAVSSALLSWYAIGLVALSSCCALALLRYARFPDFGRALLAGALAGLLIGPTILGRAVPQQYEAMFEGAVKERNDRDYHRYVGEALVTGLPSMSTEARATAVEQNAQQLAQAEAALAVARWDHQRPMRAFTMIIAAMVMLSSATRSVRAGDSRQGRITPASVGVWSLALPGALAYLSGIRWWGLGVGEAAMLAAAVGIGPWALTTIDRRLADEAELGGARMMQTAGRVAASLAIVLAMGAAWHERGWTGAVIIAPLAALPLSWFVSLDKAARSAAVEWLIEVVLAALTALVAIKFDLYEHFALWPLVVLALLADDGRWLGAFLGAMLVGGRPAFRTMRLVMPAMACGPTQLALAALALHGGLISARFALPLLAGAVLIEVTTPARLRIAERLTQAEQELEQGLDDDDDQ